MEPFDHAESLVRAGAAWLKLGIEVLGALVVAAGVVVGLVLVVRTLARRQPVQFSALRLVLARYLALALEIQLGADILGTAIAPSWEQIGQLGAIAVIRTLLNVFLARELQEVPPAAQRAHEAAATDAAQGRPPGAAESGNRLDGAGEGPR